MSVEIEATGALKSDVTDGKHPLARDMGRQTRRIAKSAGGRVTRFEVINGHIFISLKDEKGFPELKSEFSAMTGVQIRQVTPLMLVFMKSAATALVKS